MSIDLSKMPKIGFGLMRLPETNGVIDLDKVCKMVDAYLDAGFNYFDTAYVYHGGNSEKTVKEAIIKCLSDYEVPVLTDLNITNNEKGKPEISYKNYKILVSISHERNYSIAVASLEGFVEE